MFDDVTDEELLKRYDNVRYSISMANAGSGSGYTLNNNKLNIRIEIDKRGLTPNKPDSDYLL